MIKALFFDIDGTLVSFNTHAIPPTTIEAIAAAKAKGIRIFIATGRPAVIINNLSALQDFPRIRFRKVSALLLLAMAGFQ